MDTSEGYEPLCVPCKMNQHTYYKYCSGCQRRKEMLELTALFQKHWAEKYEKEILKKHDNKEI